MWGRFLNADGQINSDRSLVALNLYAYCANNPVANNENFEDAGAYAGPFHTATINVWRSNFRHSTSSSCMSYGLGYSFTGTPQLFDCSSSYSYYILLFTLFEAKKEKAR